MGKRESKPRLNLSRPNRNSQVARPRTKFDSERTNYTSKVVVRTAGIRTTGSRRSETSPRSIRRAESTLRVPGALRSLRCWDVDLVRGNEFGIRHLVLQSHVLEGWLLIR